MAAFTYDFKEEAVCEQGSTFRRVILCKDENGDPFDFTDWSARMKIRTAGGITLAALTNTNGKIVIDLVLGTMTLILLSEETAEIVSGIHFYDLEIAKDEGDPSEDVVRLLNGQFVVSEEMTR